MTWNFEKAWPFCFNWAGRLKLLILENRVAPNKKGDQWAALCIIEVRVFGYSVVAKVFQLPPSTLEMKIASAAT